VKKYWNAVKRPKYGRGRGVNPCIDCKVIMLKEAKNYMKETRAKFVATGEVLGERPMSQRRKIMEVIAQESGLKDILLRPLSAKLLPPTLPEREGWIKRENLLDIKGRARKVQIELAQKWGIDFFPSPAGGCILTDPSFSRRVKDLLKYTPEATLKDAELLKYGRHFRLERDIKLIVGRNEKENEILLRFLMPSDILLTAKDFPSPLAILRGNKITPPILNLACGIVLRYSDAPSNSIGEVKVVGKEGEVTFITRKLSPEEVKKWII